MNESSFAFATGSCYSAQSASSLSLSLSDSLFIRPRESRPKAAFGPSSSLVSSTAFIMIWRGAARKSRARSAARAGAARREALITFSPLSLPHLIIVVFYTHMWPLLCKHTHTHVCAFSLSLSPSLAHKTCPRSPCPCIRTCDSFLSYLSASSDKSLSFMTESIDVVRSAV